MDANPKTAPDAFEDHVIIESPMFHLEAHADGGPSIPQRQRLIEADSATRKQYPMTTGLLDYFPDALAEVAKLSYLGNLKHNPGQPLHHSRGKSTDHPDCIMRHLVERGGFEDVVIDGVTYQQRHSASLVWRALANLQEELEREYNLPLPRGASFD